MKRSFCIVLIFLFLSLAIVAHGEENNLQQGEFKILAYSLSNHSDEHGTESSEKSVCFHSLYISSEAMKTVLNSDEAFLGNQSTPINTTPYKGFALRGAYAPTSNITFHSSIGLTDTIKKSTLNYSDRIGWEVDLGVAYKIFKNFAYELHFGYMDTGELFKESSRFADVDDITIVTNKLTMSF